MKSFNITVDKSLQLNQSLAYQTISGILIGNQHYDQITMGVPRLFGVREAASCLNLLSNISIGSELPVSISKEPVPSATLAYHLELASQKPKTACFFIVNGNTVVFIPLTPNYVLSIDSHLHGQTGAFVALCERRHIYELLTWYKSFNNFQYSLGTVTRVTFHLINTNNQMSETCSFRYFRDNIKRVIVIVSAHF